MGWVAMTGMGIVRAAGAAGMVRYLSTCGHSRADEYLSEHGRAVVTWRGIGADGQLVERELDADQFGRFMAGLDPDTGESRWAQAVEPQHVAAVDFLVNGPKEWSILAVLDPEVRAALLRGQVNAERAVLRYLWENGTVQVKRAGQVVRVAVERIEIASVQHFSSRAGDPHFHRHMEISARVWAAGKWRALDSLGARNLNVAVQAIFHREQLREVRPILEGLGYQLDELGQIRLLRPVVEAMSRRAAQLERNLARIEAEWRAEHPGQEPSARLARLWDVQAWEQERPYKAESGVLKDELAVWAVRIGEVLAEHRISLPTPALVAADLRVGVALLDRDALAAEIVEAQGLKRSAWSRADLEAAAILAVEGRVTGDRAAVDEAAADVAARALGLSQLLPGVAQGVPSAAVKWFTSVGVIERENELRTGLAVLASAGRLSVVEGAAGAGKTTSLAEHVAEAAAAGQRLVLVAPTGAAANVAAVHAGVEASTIDRFLMRYGWGKNVAGGWEWIEPHSPADALPTGGRLVVDEAGMVSQDAARALVMTAIAHGWQVRVQGDSFQFGAVGVGGVMELAKHAADPSRVWLLDDANDVHRFRLPNGDRDEAYAAHSVVLRTGVDPERAARTVMERARVYSSDAERAAVVAAGWAARAHAGTGLVIAGTNEQVQLLNGLIRDQLMATGTIRVGKTVTTTPLQGRWESETISAGDVVATRVNAAGTDGGRYANRERWRVRTVDAEGGLRLVSLDGNRAVHLDAQAARQHVQLAYAVTGYGAQGLTVDEAVQLVDEGTDRPGFYVGATRGRYTNQTALVAENADPDLARRQVEDILGQPGADTGWRAADLAAAADRQRMGDLVDLPSRHVPPISGGQVAEAAEQIARDADWPDEVRDPHLFDRALAHVDQLQRQRALDAARQDASLEQLRGRLAQAVDAHRQTASRVAVEADRVGQAEQTTRAAQEAVLAAEDRVRHANPFNRSGRERDLTAARHTLWDAQQAETGKRVHHAELIQSAHRRQEAVRRIAGEVELAETQLGRLQDGRHQLTLDLMPLPGVEYHHSYSRGDLETLRDAWLAEPRPRQAADPARAIIQLVNDNRHLADLATPGQWHTLADAARPDDLVWGGDWDRPWLRGMRRPLLGWLGQQATRLASDPQWHDAADQLTSRSTAIQQAAETRRAQLKPDRPPTETRIDPHREPPTLGRPGPDLTPGR
jgi:conjugative relaxase-like TrwC/TraI family protein